MYQTIVQAVLAHGGQTPGRMAIGCGGVRITYGQLCGQMKCMASRLAKGQDVQKGDFIMLQGVSRPDYIVAWLAIQYLGAVSIPTDKIAKEENILDVYRYSRAKFLLTDAPVEAEDVKCISLQESYESAVKEAASGCIPDLPYVAPEKSAVSEILFTTGTTGKPKGTMLTIGSIYAIIHNMKKGIGIEEDERILIPLPLNHSLGMRSLRAGLYVGGSVVLQEGFAFARAISDSISEFQCTAMVCVPTSMELMYRQMRRHFAKIMGQLRYIEVGAGSLGYDMKKKLVAELPDTRVVNTWGSTESGGAIFLNLGLHHDKLTALGKPLDSVEVRIVDKEGNDITATARDIDTAGRMILRGDMQMAGYFRMPEATAEALVNGWLYTNDIVYMDDDGFVYMMGRADDIINVGGEKVSPIEVENIAQEFGEIRECACIGVRDESLGQIPALFVVPENGGFHQTELIRFMSERVEKYKLPQRFVLIDALPRNRMQKLNRKELYRMWQERAGTDGVVRR